MNRFEMPTGEWRFRIYNRGGDFHEADADFDETRQSPPPINNLLPAFGKAESKELLIQLPPNHFEPPAKTQLCPGDSASCHPVLLKSKATATLTFPFEAELWNLMQQN